MIFRQFIDDDLGCASYLVASGGQAAVVDPAWDVAPYLSFARFHHLTITRIFETHTHADHVSGRGRLAASTGANVLVPVNAGATDFHTAVSDGDRFFFGDVRIDVIATPGHRPEHVSYAIADLARSPEIQAVLTGDSLLVGDLARPDLAVDGDDELAHAAIQLIDSAWRLASLPEHVEIWPGHIGGSLCCAGQTSEKPSSTIGAERRTNAGLLAGDERSTRAHLLERLPDRPPTVERVVALNRAAVAYPEFESPRLTPAAARRLVDDGARVIDGRSAAAFDQGSIRGALSLPLDQPSVGSRAAWLIGDRPVVLLAEDRGAVCRLAARLAAVGLTDVRGYLVGAPAEWRRDGFAMTQVTSVDVDTAAALVEAGTVVLVDVRDEDERTDTIPGALLLPWRELPAHTAELAELDRSILVACASGRRTSVAASIVAGAVGRPVYRIAEGGIPALGRLLSVPV